MTVGAEEAARWTAAARETTGADIEVLWREGWVVRVGDVFFPSPDLLDRSDPDWKRWAARPQKHIRDAADYWFHVYQPRRGDVIADIGAGRGEDVFAFSREIGEAGRVWAIEAHPGTFAILDRFCELNGLSNVTRLN